MSKASEDQLAQRWTWERDSSGKGIFISLAETSLDTPNVIAKVYSEEAAEHIVNLHNREWGYSP